MALVTHDAFIEWHLVTCMEQDHYGYDEEYPICRDNFVAPVETECAHKFCSECAHEWFTRSASCSSCRREQYDKNTVPHHWPASNEDFDLEEHLSFSVDRVEVNRRLFELNMLTEDDFDFNIAEDCSFLAAFEDLIFAVVGTMICPRSEVRKDSGPETEEADKRDWVQVAHDIEDVLRMYHHSIVCAARFREVVMKTLYPGFSHAEHVAADSEEESVKNEEDQEEETRKDVDEWDWKGHHDNISLLVDLLDILRSQALSDTECAGPLA